MQGAAPRGYAAGLFHGRGRVAAAIVVPMLFLLGSCDQVFQDPSKRALDTAEKKYSAGDYPGAIQYYESALDGTAATAEIHYKMALLYDDKLKNPLAATYHFQRYLDLNPSGSHAKEVRTFIQEDNLKLVGSLSQGAMMSQADAARLKNDNLALRKQIVELRAAPRAAGVQGGEPAGSIDPGKPLPAGATTYEVQRGDTLASIARKFYKGSTRWKDIQDANYSTLKGTVKLKAGMTLVIPK
ncbi:MAG: LysM peptidoglycan-binding domain-containing protein [Chthoniobacteraceae bacterium]